MLGSMIFPALFAFCQPTAFSYTGKLGNQTGAFDLIFSLYAAKTGGVPATAPVTNSSINVSNGVFTVTLDFGIGAFANGAARWLEVSARAAGQKNFAPAQPRELIPTPYEVSRLEDYRKKARVTNKTTKPESIFRGSESANLILQYFRPDTIYMKYPAAREGSFLTIFTRENILDGIQQHVSSRDLALILLGNIYTETQEAELFEEWTSLLKTCGFRRILFLRNGKNKKIDGLPIIHEFDIADAHEPAHTIAVTALQQTGTAALPSAP